MRIKRIPAPWRTPTPPTLVTKPTETEKSVRVLLPPPHRSAHALTTKPAPLRRRLLASVHASDRDRQMATQPHHPWGCWIFAGRAARSRSNSLVISTTEQHAALPYQGSGHWRPKMQSA